MTTTRITRHGPKFNMHCPSRGGWCRQYFEFGYSDFGNVECPNCGFEFALEEPRRTEVFMVDVVPHNDPDRKPDDKRRYDV